MSKVVGFIWGFNKLRSRNVAGQDAINLIIEKVEAGTPKSSPYAYRRPRLKVWQRLGSAPVRQLFYQDGRMFSVSGGNFYENFSNQTSTLRGTVAQDQNPATIHTNGQDDGQQLFIVSGGLGYIYDLVANTLAQITDPEFVTPALMGTFLNSRFISLKANSNQFNWCEVQDGEDWNALEVARPSQTSDNILSIQASHGTLWLFGSLTTSVWWNSASGNAVFQPIDSARITYGIAGSWCVTPCDNTLYWLATNIDGSRLVMRADGYTAVRVSTHAIETYLSSLATVSDSIAWTYQDEGHTFFVLYLPSAEFTLVYDVSSQTWVRWSVWDPDVARHFPYLGRCHVYAFDKHLVGDRQSGTIYEQVLEPGNDSFILAAGL
jgi:hypothetical protein